MTDAPLLAVQGLSRRFGGLVALDDLTFAIRQGELVSLIGPNGAGKTTAFNLIAGFLAPTSGRVVYAGRDLTGMAPHRRARLGLVRTFQQAAVFGDQTAVDCVVAGSHVRAEAGIQAGFFGTPGARRDEASRYEAALEVLRLCGLDSRATSRASDLPYGEQKVLGIAIALASRPRLLMLDEPTAGLNAVESESVSAILDRINEQGVTVFVVEHDMRVVMGLSDRVIVLDHGQVIADDTPDRVRADDAVIRAYLGDFDIA
ncbi:MAG: ABC transporter ATP-binding protein [Anaerolinea sp.]|jgi:branched-chain amino acid transport system ATP-binding protein|nr:ABC transporter ATP-binding protein [Anaerolinea sp.]